MSFVDTGGTYQGVIYGIEDDPNYEVGDRVIAFFKEYSPGKYRVAGGPSGRFGVTGGVVKPMVKDGVPFAGEISETDFAARVQNE